MPNDPGETKPRRRGRRPLFRAALRFGPFVLLAAENVGVFWNHYFRGWGFPWDFLGSYYAMVAYWTSAIRFGSVPDWVPYQSMGYPLAVNLQSGIHYPVFRLFPLLDAGYSLHRAVVVQALHVLVGALGAYALARRCGRARRDALVAALAFQLFGGFFSNAEHPDIVRGFALAPWPLWSLTLPPARARVRSRAHFPLFAPIAVFLLATGGYPGILVAGLFLGGLWVAFQAADRIASGEPARPLAAFAVAAAALSALGLAMAAAHLGPAWLHRAELARYSERSAYETIALGLAHLPGLFLPNVLLPGNASMTSTFLPLPLLLAACWASWKDRGTRAAIVLTAAAAAMVAGSASPIYALAAKIAPPLGYSRVPAADYRAFVALGLALLGAAGLARLRRPATRFWKSWRLLLFAGALAASLGAALSGRREGTVAALAVGSAAAAILLFALSSLLNRRPRGTALALTAALCLLVVADAGRVLLHMQHMNGDLWRFPDADTACRRAFGDAFPQGFDGTVPRSLFEKKDGPRGPRHDAGRYRAAGYLRGELLMSDYGGTVLVARRVVEADPRRTEFMKRGWTPLLLAPGNPSDAEVAFSRALADAAARGWPADGRVSQTSWSAGELAYDVRLAEPALLVENEIYFPGWGATLSGENGRTIDAVRVAGAFRGWALPAGTYRMTAGFAFPERRPLAAVTGAAWAIWLLILGLTLAARRRPARRPRPTSSGAAAAK